LDEFRILCPKFPALSDRDAWENKNIADFSPDSIAGVCCQRLKCRSRPLRVRESERGLICPHHPIHHDGVHQKRTLQVGTGNVGRRQTRSRKINFFQIGVVEFGDWWRGRWPRALRPGTTPPTKHVATVRPKRSVSRSSHATIAEPIRSSRATRAWGPSGVSISGVSIPNRRTVISPPSGASVQAIPACPRPGPPLGPQASGPEWAPALR
jgi:hypothetical protein